jgi:hypothetical protein
MKKTFRLLTSFMLLLTVLTTVHGQNTSQNATSTIQHFNEPKGYKTLGIDVGLSYQSSDVKSAFGGWGLGVTLEKNLAHTTGGAADFGVRGRLMYAKSLGFNTSPSTGISGNPAVNGTYNSAANYKPEGSYYANYRTDQVELGIEGVLTLNRLRERTGVYATLFGGFGLNYSDVKTDQLNGSSQKYAYSTLKNPTVADVRGFLDGTFETKADGFGDSAQINFMPNLGIELGYHFSPRFMVVLGHKFTFSKTDLLDGQRWKDNTTLTAQNDIHHYTNLQFKWILGKSKRQVFDGDPPKVTILRPSSSPYNTYDAIETVHAEVLGVSYNEDITITVNGKPALFTYKNNDASTDALLLMGENNIIIKAENQFGSDYKTIIINRLEKQRLPDPPVVVTPPVVVAPNTPTTQSPRVKFTSPASYSETDRDRQAIRVRIDNVTNYQDVTLTVNGRNYNDFRFSYGELSHELPLNEGQNSIIVSARNSAGSSSDAVTVNYRPIVVQRVNLPLVRITSTSNPIENSFGGCQTTIEARIENVSNGRDITMTVNGRAFTDFNFNYSTKILRGSINLATGSNQIIVRARNESGEANDRADVNCAENRRNPPTVQISQPRNNDVVEQQTIDIRAITTNVTAQNQIQMVVNGYQNSNFTFSTYNRTVSARLNLVEGENTIRIRVSNNDGAQEDIVRFTYRPRVVTTPPRVTISQPISGTFAKNSDIDVQATTKNINNQSQIQLTLNGRGQSFNFEPSTQLIRTRLELNAGMNTIRITVTNPSGSDAATATLTYNKLVITETPRPPRVNILNPTDGKTVTDPSVTLEAQIDNMPAGSKDIKIILNGTEMVGNMNVMRQIRQRLSLVEGINTITVSATNKDGKDEKTVRVTYGKIVVPPTKGNGKDIPNRGDVDNTVSPLPTISNFNVTQPVTDPFDPKPLVSVVTATITKTPKAYIVFKVNGEDVKTFEFDELTGQFRYSFGVKSGTSYTFYIRAYNLEGQTEKTETVKF